MLPRRRPYVLFMLLMGSFIVIVYLRMQENIQGRVNYYLKIKLTLHKLNFLQ
jgi:hypothetical protein